MPDERRFYEAGGSGVRRSAPAALRNREPIAKVLAEWLRPRASVLEIASGTGEHVAYFAARFPGLEWQPSDVHPDAIASIAAWREHIGLPNIRAPLVIDAAAAHWPIKPADMKRANTDWPFEVRGRAKAEGGIFSAVLCINMVHIAPWTAALGLLEGSARVLASRGALIVYGPWLQASVPAGPGNLEFDRDLKARDPQWGLRLVEDFEAEALKRGFVLEQTRAMPADNLAMLFQFHH